MEKYVMNELIKNINLKIVSSKRDYTRASKH